jgi:hypothetical protein
MNRGLRQCRGILMLGNKLDAAGFVLKLLFASFHHRRHGGRPMLAKRSNVTFAITTGCVPPQKLFARLACLV